MAIPGFDMNLGHVVKRSVTLTPTPRPRNVNSIINRVATIVSGMAGGKTSVVLDHGVLQGTCPVLTRRGYTYDNDLTGPKPAVIVRVSFYFLGRTIDFQPGAESNASNMLFTTPEAFRTFADHTGALVESYLKVALKAIGVKMGLEVGVGVIEENRPALNVAVRLMGFRYKSARA
jgi:hypothetical protein